MGRVTFRNLNANKRRLVSTFFGVLLGVAFLTGTLVLSDTITRTFNELFADVTAGTDAFVRNDEHHRALVTELRELLDTAALGGPQGSRDKHVSRGKLLPRDRVDTLLDRGSAFLELSPLAAHGLYDGDGSLPATKGVAWVIGIGQGTTDLSVYQSRLQEWYADTAFWAAMSRDVSDWMQEVFGEPGRHARSAVGVPVLPLGVAVEVDAVVQVRS